MLLYPPAVHLCYAFNIQQHLIDIYVIDDIQYTRYNVDGHCTGLRRDCCHPPDWIMRAWPRLPGLQPRLSARVSCCHGGCEDVGSASWLFSAGSHPQESFGHRTRQHSISIQSTETKYYLYLQYGVTAAPCPCTPPNLAWVSRLMTWTLPRHSQIC